MKRLYLMICVSGVILALMNIGVYGYDWKPYNGHQYALTLDYVTWQQAEAEAVLVGGHLVTINDFEENAWVTDFIKDTQTRSHYSPPPSVHNIAWIGYRLFEGEWGWANGEPVTFTNLCSTWDGYNGEYAYLHGANHPDPGTWNHNSLHDYDYDHNIRGVIEVPEPATLLLFGLGSFALLRRKR